MPDVLAKDRRVYISGSNYDYLKRYQEQHGYRDLADTVNTLIGHYRVMGEQALSVPSFSPVAPSPQTTMVMASKEQLLAQTDDDDFAAMEGW